MDLPRSGRPSVTQKLTEKRVLTALDKHSRKQGFADNEWTVAILAQFLNYRHDTQVSEATLRRRIHDISLRYNLPKFVYEEKEPNRAQKKGRSPAGLISCQKTP